MRKRNLSSHKARDIQQAMADVEDAYEVVRRAWINLAKTISPRHEQRGIYLWYVQFHWQNLCMGDDERLRLMSDLLHIGGLSVVDVFPETDTREPTEKQIDALRSMNIDGGNLTYAQAARRIREHNRKASNLQRYKRNQNSKRKQHAGALGSEIAESKETP